MRYQLEIEIVLTASIFFQGAGLSFHSKHMEQIYTQPIF